MVWEVFEGKRLSPEISSLKDDTVTAGTGNQPGEQGTHRPVLGFEALVRRNQPGEQGTHRPVLAFEALVRRLIFHQGHQEPKGTQGPGDRAAMAAGARVPPIIRGLNKHTQAPEEKGRE